LEEPPAHAIFVLCTTEAEKLPGTIISRCLELKFTRASDEELTRSLKRVVIGEDLKIEADAVAKIASASGGSFRDAVKLLEELAATGKKISSSKVEAKVSGGISLDKLDSWLMLVYSHQTRPAIDWLQKAWIQGVRPKNLLLMALERLRQILLVKVGAGKGKDLEAIDNLDQLRQLTARFLRAGRQMKTAEIESLPLELAVVAWGQAEQKPQEKVASSPPGPAPEKPAEPSREFGPPSQSMLENWRKVLAAVKPLNHSLEALLKATEPVEFDQRWLTLKVYYKFHKERLEEERYRMMIESVASKIMVCPVKIKLVLSEKPKAAANIVEVEEPDIIKTAEEIFGVGGDN
jgi:DNA polymerase-3 subunit gamma/tau